jgi:UDP-N-acetylmuramoylalanine--D-glutamate ligase
MKVAVIGLGIEGSAAVKTLIKRGYQVYASDINAMVTMEPHPGLTADIGYHDLKKIESSDAIMISPSLWGIEKFSGLKNSGKLLSDIFNSYKSIPTIGVTGTNGKTTTCIMITHILENAGYKVLVGGNAGGGFDGYAEIIMEANSGQYDMIVVEVCDMTLNYCKDTFDMDVVVVTNQGRDHLEVHKSQENYLKSLEEFIKGKKAVLNGEDPFLVDIANSADESHFFKKGHQILRLFGEFNQENAAAAKKVCEVIGIPLHQIDQGLQTFEGVEGRTTELSILGSNIIIGKTDNADAAAAVLKEKNFKLVIIGTPRKNEHWRYDILDEVVNTNPKIIGLFPGLDNTVPIAREKIRSKGFNGKIMEFEGVQEVFDQMLACIPYYRNIFIGGNGQSKLIEIKEKLENLQKKDVGGD